MIDWAETMLYAILGIIGGATVLFPQIYNDMKRKKKGIMSQTKAKNPEESNNAL